MLEQGQTEEGGGSGGGKGAVPSSSGGNQSPLTGKVASSCHHHYPPALAKYEDVVADPALFVDTLRKLHAAMGTKFMIPVIGGRDLDLHRLFVAVTSRGGIEKVSWGDYLANTMAHSFAYSYMLYRGHEKSVFLDRASGQGQQPFPVGMLAYTEGNVLREKRWKEVTAAFCFPPTATNASFVLRKYYYSLLQHYEQIYFFKTRGWIPSLPPDLMEFRLGYCCHFVALANWCYSLISALVATVSGASSSSVSCPVVGVIDGKFDTGYLVTVTVGTEKLKGVLYLAPPDPLEGAPPLNSCVFADQGYGSPPATGLRRRRRRKKSEMRKRDPTHPKPNRSGYNFFFAEQHARLKPLYPGKDREISRMIGELWTNLICSDKAVYQEKALKDKERYRIEMAEYRERLRSSEVISDAVPIRQRPPNPDVEMVELGAKDGKGWDSPVNGSESGMSETEDDRPADKGEDESDTETPENAGSGKQNEEDGGR
ncbi:hypothetical protein Nepgr_009873 [Nepenthes gracilis]|uniref:HMG box domain-containing protein n=1 Tax=Nepenthes gracilis TaxID=150966 RepID=A0AAD3SBB4_NEPGR|nr:hypothetical protein Nepgr_009873 [Nepenthes gracilis]